MHHSIDFSNYQLNAQFVYSSRICMLHYEPQHVSSSTLLILRRTNCITTASGIVTLCKQPYSMHVESGVILYYTAITHPNINTKILPECSPPEIKYQKLAKTQVTVQLHPLTAYSEQFISQHSLLHCQRFTFSPTYLYQKDEQAYLEICQLPCNKRSDSYYHLPSSTCLLFL